MPISIGACRSPRQRAPRRRGQTKDRCRPSTSWVAPSWAKTAGDAVTNSFGQTHEIANLWIAGPGIFPTSGAPNPTYTILALSLRGAEQLAKNWGSVAD